MLMTVEALNARHGDALLLHYGPEDSPRLVVCDGGPAGVYGAAMEPRLTALREARGPAEPLPIDLVIDTHLDDDHIHGLVDLFSQLAEASDDQRDLPWNVRQLWVNHFDGLVGGGGGDLVSAAAAVARPDRGIPPGLMTTADALAVAASVPQGRALMDYARKLVVTVNGPPLDGLVTAGEGGGPNVDLGSGLSLTVIAPSRARVDALHEEWDAVLASARTKPSHGALAEVAAFLDQSVYNLSSIVLLARAGDATMLLTGDARGDDILRAMDAAGLLPGGRIHVDLLKIPHHGSSNNVDQNFFDAVTADHYLISADGKYGNPDDAVLQMLLNARTGDEFVIHLTNEIPRVTEFLQRSGAPAHRYRVSTRSDDAVSLTIDLSQHG